MRRGREKYTELEGRKHRVPQMKTKENLRLNINTVFPIKLIVTCLYEITRWIVEERKCS